MTALLDLARIVVMAAATAHGLPADSLVSLMQCESGLDRYAVNGQYVGLAQLGTVKQAEFFREGFTDLWSPADQANYTADRILAGEAGAWPQCSRGLRWS